MSRTERTPGSPGWLAPLGRTGLELSGIVAGGAPLASIPGVYGRAVSYAQGVATVSEVLRSPIRGIDTANEYGAGESERRIGAALGALDRVPGDFVVMTKADPVDGDYSAERVRHSVAQSRERLGLERIPLVHLHDPELFQFEDVTGPGGAVQALVELREAGIIGAIGLAGGPVREMDRYLALGVFDVLLVHNRWTLVDRSAGGLIERAAGAGLGVLNAAVYGGGALANPTGTTTYGYRPIHPQTASAVRAMSAVCTRFGTDLRTAALQFSLRDPRVGATIVGMSRPERVHDAMRMAAAPLPDELWDELETLVPPSSAWLDPW